jgi:hypothetical protein
MRHHAGERLVDARRDRKGARERDNLLNEAEIEGKFLARDLESDKDLARLRQGFWRVRRNDAARRLLVGRAGAPGERFGKKRLDV